MTEVSEQARERWAELCRTTREQPGPLLVQQVSDAAKVAGARLGSIEDAEAYEGLAPFILPDPPVDPLTSKVIDAFEASTGTTDPIVWANSFEVELNKRGLEIREVQP